MTQLGRYILPRPYKNSKDTEEVYQLLGGGNRENVEVSEDLAGHAAKGLRLWLEHKVLDEDAELVESDTEPGLVYWWDREAKLFKRGWMGPDGLEKTQDLDPGYFNRGQRVRYSSHHFACIFALGYDVIIPITPKSTDAIQRETAYAEGISSGPQGHPRCL